MEICGLGARPLFWGRERRGVLGRYSTTLDLDCGHWRQFGVPMASTKPRKVAPNFPRVWPVEAAFYQGQTNDHREGNFRFDPINFFNLIKKVSDPDLFGALD